MNGFRPRVEVSGVLELSRFLRSHALVTAGHTLPGVPDAVRHAASRLEPFWNDQLTRPLELLVLADLTGCVLDADPNRLFDELAGVQWEPPLRVLATEDPLERALTAARLERLVHDPDLMAGYIGHLREAWRLLAPWWCSDGYTRATVQADAIRERLDTATHLTELLPIGHSAHADSWRALLEVAGARNRVVVVPAVVNPRRGYAIALDELVVIGVGWADDRTPGGARRHAAGVSEVLRPLIDPTRLALLMYLADHARSVNQLADEFDLAPATVSAHLRILRDFELVEEVREGKRTLFRSSATEIRAILLSAEAQIREHLG